MGNLPKYIQNANRVLGVLAEQPDGVWGKTQRELGEHLEYSQPELSILLKTLLEAGKIKRGAPLPGVRGRNTSLEVIDATPLDTALRRVRPVKVQDRAMTDEEEIQGPIDLQDMSIEKVGFAVLRILKDAWSAEERHARDRNEYLARIRDMRDKLSEERQLRTRLADDRETLQRKVETQDEEIARMRAEINQLLMRANQRRSGGGGFKVHEMLDGDELRVLENLMKMRPESPKAYSA